MLLFFLQINLHFASTKTLPFALQLLSATVCHYFPIANIFSSDHILIYGLIFSHPIFPQQEPHSTAPRQHHHYYRFAASSNIATNPTVIPNSTLPHLTVRHLNFPASSCATPNNVVSKGRCIPQRIIQAIWP